MGRLGPDSINAATGLCPATRTRQPADRPIRHKLAGIFADPTRGPGELEKVVESLDDRTRQTVSSLQAHSAAEGAVRLLIDGTSTALSTMVQPQSGRQRFTTFWVDAIWTDEEPYDAVVEIKDHLASYTDHVDAMEQRAASVRAIVFGR